MYVAVCGDKYQLLSTHAYLLRLAASASALQVERELAEQCLGLHCPTLVPHKCPYCDLKS